MTPIELLEGLQTFIEKATNDLLLPQKPVTGKPQAGPAPAAVFKMGIPAPEGNPENQTNRIPYILLQLFTGKDSQNSGEDPESECKIRIVFAVYGQDKSTGMMDLLNLMTRTRISLIEAGVISDMFLLKKPLEWLIYLEQTSPYYLGEMITVWEMPEIKRKVDLSGN